MLWQEMSTQTEIWIAAARRNNGVSRANPDGSDIESFVWGVRNGFGMVFDEAGDLYEFK